MSQGRIVAPPEEADEEAAAVAEASVLTKEAGASEDSSKAPVADAKAASWFFWLKRPSAGANQDAVQVQQALDEHHGLEMKGVLPLRVDISLSKSTVHPNSRELLNQGDPQ